MNFFKKDPLQKMKKKITGHHRNFLLKLGVFLFLGLSSCSHASSKNSTSDRVKFRSKSAEKSGPTIQETFVLCKNGGHIRTLRIQPQQESTGCQTYYGKDGADQSIGSSRDPQKCQQILESVRNNLVQGQWHCRNIKEARLSNLTPDSQESQSNE